MIIGRLKVNHMKNPMGYDIKEPVFSWVVLKSTGKKQKEARLLAGLDEEFCQVLYDSGRQEDMESLGTRVSMELKPRTRYYWKVEVWADDGDHGVSDTAWFETGKLDEEWQGKWIEAPFDKDIHPCFRKEFKLEEEILSARAYVCGLGVYELQINGEKAGEEYLMPGYYDYGNWLQYQTYDVTSLLKKGDNVLGAMLGNGWYKGRFGFMPDMKELYGDRMKFICELWVTLPGKEICAVAADEGFLCRESPVLESSIYNGEWFDANRKADAGNGFYKAVLSAAPEAPLKKRLNPALTIHDRLSPAELIRNEAGEMILDFGQEITGWVEFPCKAPKGGEVHLQYGEILQEGKFYNDNLRTAKAEYRYISDGTPAWVRPYFTYYGFRYVKVTGLTEEEMMASEGCVIYSDLEETGFIETSDSRINRLFANALWGQRGNFLDVPTDCPQRDERMGWTGDAQVFAATASYNMDTAAFYRKYLFDMLLEQRECEGAVPDVVPNAIGRIHQIRGEEERSAGACAWGDAAAVIPWTMYLFYGDKSLLDSQFENMCLWVKYIKSQDEEHCGGRRLWTCGFHYGDWLALDNPDKESRFGGTDKYYVASAYYYYSAWLTAMAAKVLGKKSEEEYFGTLANEVKAAFRKEYFNPQGDILVSTQTAMVMALYLNLVPDGEPRERLVQALKGKLDERNVHLDTGFVGTPWLCPVLSDNHLKEYAYTLLFHEDYPSWLYEVSMGATTIWERWNSVLPDGSISGTGMNSLNHYAYGSIVEWMYRYMCGINPVWDTPGFRHGVLKPQSDPRLAWVKGVYHSPAGEYRLSWEIRESEIVYEVKVPFGAYADFILEPDMKEPMLNGAVSKELEQNGTVRLESGSYRITARRQEMQTIPADPANIA